MAINDDLLIKEKERNQGKWKIGILTKSSLDLMEQ